MIDFLNRRSSDGTSALPPPPYGPPPPAPTSRPRTDEVEDSVNNILSVPPTGGRVGYKYHDEL